MNARNRSFEKEQSFKNPIFLQLNFAIESVKSYFQSLPNDKKLTIVDFGCGQKPYEVFVNNHEYIGIDIDKSNDKADIYADITNIPIDDGAADIVTSFYVLEHVEEPQKVINEKFRILKKNGELFMLIPMYWEEHEQPYDFFRFTRFGIIKLMENAGFKDIKVREINTAPSILGMNLAILFNRRFFKVLIPVINYIFYKLEIRMQRKAIKNNILLSNVMTFEVKGQK